MTHYVTSKWATFFNVTCGLAFLEAKRERKYYSFELLVEDLMDDDISALVEAKWKRLYIGGVLST